MGWVHCFVVQSGGCTFADDALRTCRDPGLENELDGGEGGKSNTSTWHQITGLRFPLAPLLSVSVKFLQAPANKQLPVRAIV